MGRPQGTSNFDWPQHRSCLRKLLRQPSFSPGRQWRYAIRLPGRLAGTTSVAARLAYNNSLCRMATRRHRRLAATNKTELGCRRPRRRPRQCLSRNFFLFRGLFIMQILKVRRILLILSICLFELFAVATRADTFKLNNGETLTGEVLSASANDEGVQIKLGEGDYKRVPWSNFSQEDLKKFAENRKMAPFVEPFIEVSREEKMKKTEVDIKEPPRLSRPSAHSFFSAMFSSGVGLVVLLLLYAANIYAAYEIAIFRAQPIPLVCGVAAVLPILRPIIFPC